MPVGDRQKLITMIVGTVLGEKPHTDFKFEWFINKHTKEHFGEDFTVIENIFTALNGNLTANRTKRTISLDCDAFFGGQYNFIFEFDEFQHFTSARLKTFLYYPSTLKVNFNIEQWKQLCLANMEQANKYRKSKKTTDFDFDGGRTAQRAYLDCFRDLLPQQHKLMPTLRISEFEVDDIFTNNKDACKRIEMLLSNKLKFT